MSKTRTMTSPPEIAIRLRNLSSRGSIRSVQTTETLPAYADTASTSSTLPPYQNLTAHSSTSSLALCECAHNQQTFLPSKTLHIISQGKDRISLPSPSKELEISILDERKEEVKYISIKPQRRSGNCTLFENVDGLVPKTETMYRAGPGRAPIVKILNGGESKDGEELVLDSTSLVSRTVRFNYKGGIFEWRYGGKKERGMIPSDVGSSEDGEVPNNLLILEKVISTSPDKKGSEQRIVLARLIRGESTRTAGTKGSSAGNGGKLEMCLKDNEKRDLGIDEITVVSTVLVMLKKEIDRMRLIQMMVICAALSGGS